MHAAKILFLGEATGFAGGIERYAFQTAQLLRRHNFQVDWCGKTPAWEEAAFRRGFDTMLAPEAVRADYALAALHKLPPPEMLRRWRKLFGERLIFWAHDHDLYCPRHHYYTPFGRVNCRRAYSPLRCALCARIASPRSRRFLRRGQSELLRELRAHRAVVLSDFMRDNLCRNGFAPGLVRKIPPVIPVAAELAPPETPGSDAPLKILFLGQLVRGKGADLLLDALALAKFPWQLRLVGDGPDRAMLEKRVRRAGWSSQVALPGWRTDPEPELAACDAAVFPSRWQEPFGLSGAEAAAHGKPVVAFDTGGVREWLEDGRNGFLAPPGDAAALAAKLALLQRDPALRRQMGAEGRLLARERFADECFLKHFQALLEGGAVR